MSEIALAKSFPKSHFASEVNGNKSSGSKYGLAPASFFADKERYVFSVVYKIQGEYQTSLVFFVFHLFSIAKKQ